jgi:hypothetical protein
MTYVGSIILPFARCSHVVKVQCEELRITGAREATSLDPGAAAPTAGDWNLDVADHDKSFPSHPLWRTRRHLRSLAGWLRVDDRLRQEPAFGLSR